MYAVYWFKRSSRQILFMLRTKLYSNGMRLAQQSKYVTFAGYRDNISLLLLKLSHFPKRYGIFTLKFAISILDKFRCFIRYILSRECWYSKSHKVVANITSFRAVSVNENRCQLCDIYFTLPDGSYRSLMTVPSWQKRMVKGPFLLKMFPP